MSRQDRQAMAVLSDYSVVRRLSESKNMPCQCAQHISGGTWAQAQLKREGYLWQRRHASS